MSHDIGAHREADEVDGAIDEVVTAMMRAPARPGLGDRVTTRLARDTDRAGRRLAWPRWALAGSAALATCVAALAGYLALAPSSQRPTTDVALSTTRPATPATRGTASTRDGVPDVSGSTSEDRAATPGAGPGTAPPPPATRTARANPSAERGAGRSAAARETAQTDGPPPLEVPRLGRPDPVSIDAIDVGWIGAQDLAIAPLEVDDGLGPGKR